jgi:hypothetical protein
MRNDYGEFICLADEYLIAYVCLPYDLLRVKQFLITHALELYLKAVYFKNTNNYKEAIQFKHNIYRLFKSCKEKDRAFLSELKIDEKILQKFQSKNAYQKVFKEYGNIENHPFYLSCYYAGDMKYYGLKNKSINFDQDIMESESTIHYWADIFNKIRNYVNFPETSNTIDIIDQAINRNELSNEIITNLKQFIKTNKTKPKKA